jgi:hypothetical protein
MVARTANRHRTLLIADPSSDTQISPTVPPENHTGIAMMQSAQAENRTYRFLKISHRVSRLAA